MLTLNEIAISHLMHPLQAKAKIQQYDLDRFLEAFKDYKNNLDSHLSQSEDALVANALAPFLQRLDFNTAIKDKQKGKSEIDLALKKDGTVQVIIEAKNYNKQRLVYSAVR